MGRPIKRDTRSTQAGERSASSIEISDADLLLRLTGPGGERLSELSDQFGVELGLRGNSLLLRGAEQDVLQAERIVHELLEILRTDSISGAELAQAAKTLKAHPNLSLKDFREDVIVTTAMRRVVTPKSINQQRYVKAMRDADIVFGIGPAGTGKTYLAMAMAVRALQDQSVKRIILARPAVEAGERLGFLPGDLAEKIDPYLRPLHDALHDMLPEEKVSRLIERGTIEVAPLAFMRGRTLNDSFVILDEAQNSTPEQMKMFLTRLGFESKAVITGDITQIDLPGSQRSGLHDARDVLASVEGVEFVYFSDVDVVRHPLVQRIVQAYDQRDAQDLD